MIYIKAILSALSAAGLLTKLLIALGLVASLLTAYGVWHHKVYQSGVNDTVAAIARADAKLVERATKARAKLKSCQAFNKEWDQSTGNCK